MDAPDLDKKRCPFCAEEIQAAAIVCRYCGRDLVELKPPAPAATQKKESRWGCWFLVALLGCGILLALASMVRVTPSATTTWSSSPTPVAIATATPSATATLTPAEWQAAAQTVGFEELARETEAWVGKLVRLRGKVVQVSERDDNGATLRVNVTGQQGLWTDTVWVEFPGYGPGQRVLEDDIVDFVARVDGRHTYRAIFGQEITLPGMTAQWLAVE